MVGIAARTVPVAALVLLWACGGGTGTQAAGHEPAPARRSDVVTLEELSRLATSSTLYEALRALRPAWFRRNPTTLRPQSEGDVVVYLGLGHLHGAIQVITSR